MKALIPEEKVITTKIIVQKIFRTTKLQKEYNQAI